MKVLSTEGLTKLIELIKSAFISVDDTVSTNSVTLTTVATSGSYNDLSDTPTIPSAVTESTVSGWGFTKNIGTVTKVNDTSPDSNGNVTLAIPEKVFIAIYGSTTYTDILNAYSAGKTIICYWDWNTNNSSNPLQTATYHYYDNTFEFYFGFPNTIYTAKITSTATWLNRSVANEIQSNKVTSISSSSTDTQYPSAKCVYDAINEVQTLQSITSVTYAASQTITLTANSSIYKLIPTGDITSMAFSLSASEGASATTAYTFELYLDISSTLRSVAFPDLSVLTWQDGEQPDLSETGVYLFAFRTMDGGAHWIGNLQGMW